jgi:DNA-binding GntR family transcriptional regulator
MTSGINRQPAADAVDLHARLTMALRQQIMRGELPPGIRVPEARLCALLGVSRTPLREALKVLSVEGWVTLRPNRGAIVTLLDHDELQDMFIAKGVLEQFIGINATLNASDADLGELQDKHDQLIAAEAARDHAAYTDLNEIFHWRLAELAGNQEILKIYDGLQKRILRVRYQINDDPERVRDSLAEHEGIMQAMLIRARHDVADRLVAHNNATARAVSAHISGLRHERWCSGQ